MRVCRVRGECILVSRLQAGGMCGAMCVDWIDMVGLSFE